VGEWHPSIDYVIPIAWVELFIGTWIASRLYETGKWRN
jgi:hypothetical protein